MKDKNSTAEFDDYVKQDHDGHEYDETHWTQVCDTCAKKHHLLDSFLSVGGGGGLICGVLGCNNEADHYYDFTED